MITCSNKARIFQKLRKNNDISQHKFRKLNGISPRYLRGILYTNFLTPKLKQKIMNGWIPKQISYRNCLYEKFCCCGVNKETRTYFEECIEIYLGKDYCVQ